MINIKNLLPLRSSPVCHPDRTRHAGTRWVTERITSRKGGKYRNQQLK